MRLLQPAALLALLAAAPVARPARAQVSQAPAGPTLTLDEAISLARRNNPAYLQTANNRRSADAQVRSAYGALLPSVGSSFSTNYQTSGESYVSGTSLRASGNSLSNSYGLGVNYSINGATLLNPRAARANREAVEADITGATEQLRAFVTQQYLTVLQAQAKAEVQDTLVALNRAQLELAQAKMAAGAATILDVRRAEVALGQAEVQALTARNAVAVEKLKLYQQLGVPQPGDVRLTTAFTVQEPTFQLDSLLALARRSNPAMEALRARENAAGVTVRARQSQYTPTLSLSTGWGAQAYGFTDDNFAVQQMQLGAKQAVSSCQQQNEIYARLAQPLPAQDCSQFAFNDGMAAAARSGNNPWGFRKSPFGVSARVSLPIFDNFSREQSVEEAKVQREDARYAVRAKDLQLNADVTQAYLNLVTAAKTVALQEQNAQKAREELAFAEERYRVGASTFLDVTTSRATFEQAQLDRINAIYNYHSAFAALENAVGRPLR